jgi:hypothetical protein
VTNGVAAQFLVDEALHILHSLSDTHNQKDTLPASPSAQFIIKVLTFVKSLSFIQYSSQEQPVTIHDSRGDNVKKAMGLLSKAAEADNPDALFLLGELNFVSPPGPLSYLTHLLMTVRELFKGELSRGFLVVKYLRSKDGEFNRNAFTRIHVCHRNRKCRRT